MGGRPAEHPVTEPNATKLDSCETVQSVAHTRTPDDWALHAHTHTHIYVYSIWLNVGHFLKVVAEGARRVTVPTGSDAPLWCAAQSVCISALSGVWLEFLLACCVSRMLHLCNATAATWAMFTTRPDPVLFEASPNLYLLASLWNSDTFRPLLWMTFASFFTIYEGKSCRFHFSLSSLHNWMSCYFHIICIILRFIGFMVICHIFLF